MSETNFNYPVIDIDKNLVDKLIDFQKIRNEFLNKYMESFNEDTFKFEMEEPSEIDEYEDKIVQELINNSNKLPFDFILEQLTHLGMAPSVIYDDNGHFAVSSDGMQEIPMEKEGSTIGLTTIVKKEQWKDSPREALENFLNELKK